MLVRMLGGHPDVAAIKWETQFLVATNGLLDLVDAGRGDRAVVRTRQMLRRFLERMNAHWWARTMRGGTSREYEAGLCADLDRDTLDAALADLGTSIERDTVLTTDAARQFTSSLFDDIVQTQQAKFWCEKTPANLINVTRLHELYPQARFIHIVRDGRDVASSMCDNQFWPIAASNRVTETEPFRGHITFEKALAYWATLLKIGEQQLATLPKDLRLDVRLEDIVNDEEATSSHIQRFLKLDPATPLARPKGKSNIGRAADDSAATESYPPLVADMLARWGYCNAHAQ
jgi:hypothetical protein